MELSKHINFFDPMKVEEQIHIIGLGALGSNLAHQLVRLGITNLKLYDFDGVEEHNITNQMYHASDIGDSKINALHKRLMDIRPNGLSIEKFPQGWKPNTPLRGFVFLCLDSIELRKQILEENQFNPAIIFVTDMRIGLEEAQMYCAEWSDFSAVERTISTMQFKDDEVEVPVSACGTQLTVLPTIQIIVSVAVMNFINYSKTKQYNYQSVINSIQGIASSYSNN